MNRVDTHHPALGSLMAQEACSALGLGCPGCRQPSWGICADCRASLSGGPEPPRWVGGQPPMRVWSVASYTDRLPPLVRAWKDGQAWTLVGPFAAALARLVNDLVGPDQPVVVVPVGSRAAAVRARHLDHTLHLARRVARSRAGPTTVLPVLRRARPVRDQRVLGVDQRWANQVGTMSLRRGAPGPPRTPVWLLDDVITTGSTLAEATRCLLAAGWPVAGGITLASTTRRQR